MILASAVVDLIDEPSGGLGKFRVEVWGKEPHDYVRIYQINAKNEDDAAREGLSKFEDDITALLERDQK